MLGRNGAIDAGPDRIATGWRDRMPMRPASETRRVLLDGLIFLIVCLPPLYVLRHFDLLPLWAALLITGEVGTIATFLVGACWLAARRPTWRRLGQYHATVAVSFIVWWVVADVLARFGVEYLLATLAAQAAALPVRLLEARSVQSAPPGQARPLAVAYIAELLANDAELDTLAWLPRESSTAGATRRGTLQRVLARLYHVPASLFLIAATAFGFQQTLFFGYRFIGNSDRLNHYISFILYHTHNLERGVFAAWSEYIYDGFDSLSLPMSFFTPLYAIPALLHTDDVVAVFGIIAPALFAFTLIEAYFVAYLLTRDRLASVAGACTYGCATYGLLKIVQSDQTYLSVLTAPAFFYLVHTCVKRNWLHRFVVLTLLVTIEFYFAFLQEFSYNVIFFFVYCAYLLLRRNIYPIAAFSLAMVSGAILSVPRLLVQYQTLADSGRGRLIPTIQDVVDARTLLRFFSRDIFGHSWRQNLQSPLQINLHEGDLVNSSVFGALLFLVIVVSLRWVFKVRKGPVIRRYNATVLVLYSLFVFAVMHNTDAYLLIDRLYQNISFQHSRISVSALLPIALVIALYLAQDRGRLGRMGLVVSAAASILIIALSAFDFAGYQDRILGLFNQPSQLFIQCDNCLPGIWTGPLLTSDALRFATLALVFVGLLVVASRFGAAGRSVLKTVLAVAIIFQTVWDASGYLEGPQTRDYTVPYETNDFVIARPDQFLPPSPAQLDQMHALLDNNDYRSVTLCPVSLTQQNCSTMIGMTWGIRLVDGYSSGVPQRLATLPWATGGHEVRFVSADLPWPILSFLNTRQAIVMTRELYMNSGLDVPNDVQIVRNPSPYVYPRAYFATTTQSVAYRAAEAAVQGELQACPPVCDGGLQARFPVDYVEGPVSGTFDAGGDLAWSGGGDRLTFDFPASASQRFLVVNETWDRGWTAVVNGHELPVYPTNLMMRGVLVPEGATEVVLEYRSLLSWAWWYTPGLMALGALVIVLVRRYGWQRRRWGWPAAPHWETHPPGEAPVDPQRTPA